MGVSGMALTELLSHFERRHAVIFSEWETPLYLWKILVSAGTQDAV
jgi:hypothetical protein